MKMRSPRSLPLVGASVLVAVSLAAAVVHPAAKANAVTPGPTGAPSTTPQKGAVLAVGDPQMRIGAAIYTDTCMACHKASGAGVDLMFPKLVGSDTILQDDPTWPVMMVLQGGRAEASGTAPTGPAMPALGWRLSDEQVADVVTYIRNSWGNAAPKVSAGDVGALRAKL